MDPRFSFWWSANCPSSIIIVNNISNFDSFVSCSSSFTLSQRCLTRGQKTNQSCSDLWKSFWNPDWFRADGFGLFLSSSSIFSFPWIKTYGYPNLPSKMIILSDHWKWPLIRTVQNEPFFKNFQSSILNSSSAISLFIRSNLSLIWKRRSKAGSIVAELSHFQKISNNFFWKRIII